MMINAQMSTQELVRRLEAHPHMRDRIASLLTVVEDDSGEFKLADDVEDRVIEEVRRMGQEAIQGWANSQVEKTTQTALDSGVLHRDGKKNCTGSPHLAK
jgi:hypothetical protein